MFSHGTERIACKVKSQHMRRMTSISVKMPDYIKRRAETIVVYPKITDGK